MQEYIATGRTVDEAVETGCTQLGLSRDAVNVEVLELPKKKFFGSSPARVRVTEREDNFSVLDILMGNDHEKKPEVKKPEPEVKVAKAPEPKREEKPAQKAEKPAQKAEKPAEKRVQREPKAPAPERAPSERREYKSNEDLPEVEISIDDLSAPAAAALAYFKQMAEGMGATDLTYSVVKTERGVKFVVDGEDASIVIGRRGETMDAMQYLCMLVSSRTEGDFCKITVDVSNYRKKREMALISLAERQAQKVLRTRYDEVLEPMNPYERRIIHSAIQEIEGVKSESTGQEPYRRVVISLESGGRSRRDNRDRGRGVHPDNRGPRAQRPGGSSDTKQYAPREPRQDGSGDTKQYAPREPRPDYDAKPAESSAPAETRPADDTKIDMLYKKIEL